MNRESIHDKLDEAWGEKEDQRTLYIGNNTVRLEKRFSPPITTYYSDMLEKYFLEKSSNPANEKRKFKHNILPNFDFYIRFYFPRNKIIKKFNGQVKDKLHLIIMFNGLDESLDKHYKLYDRLGSSFAFYGIASVLLPTPFHLNRSPLHLWETINGKPRVRTPSKSLRKNPWHLPNNFAQNINEFNYLLKLINCDFAALQEDEHMGIKTPTEDGRIFYNLFFEDYKDGKLDISLLGYSLGGLKALACFKQQPEAIKTCIVLNAGGTLQNLRLGPPLMDDETWQKEVVERLMPETRWPIPKDQEREFNAFQSQNCPHYEIISNILFAPENVFEGRDLDKHVGKIIIVAGGKDRLVEPESIKRLETKAHGLNILQIADLGHFIGDDPQFNLWYSRIINLLVTFFEDVEGEPISRDANFALFSMFDFCCDNNLVKGLGDSKDLSQLAEIVTDEMEADYEGNCKEDFYSIAKSIYAYHGATKDTPSKKGVKEDYIATLEKYKEKNDLFFGKLVAKHMYGAKKEEYKNIKEIVLNPTDSSLSGAKLVNANKLYESQISIILEKQVNQYLDMFLGDGSVVSESWKTKLCCCLEAKQQTLK